MTRAQIRARLSGDRGQRLVPLQWWAEVDGALSDPEVRVVVLWMPRQSGKTQYAMTRAVEELLLTPDAFVLFLSASRDQAESAYHRKLRRPVTALLRAAGLPATAIKLVQGGAENPAINSALAIVAANEATAPSRSVTLLIMDEARYVSDAVFGAVSPSVIGAGGKLLLVSTAGPPSGFFHALCTLPDAEVRVIRVDRNQNPHADPKVLGFLSRLLTRILPLAAKRDLENTFAADGDQFVSAEAYDACVEPEWAPCWPTKDAPIFVGIDAALKDDTAAAIGLIRDGDQLILAFHRIWRPTHATPLDLAEIEAWVLDQHRRFRLVKVLCDPYQMARSMSALRAAGVPIEEYAQTPANLTKATQTLFDALTARALVFYPSAELREQMLNAVVSDAGARGYKLAKERSSAKIDSAVALSMACVAAIDAPVLEPAFVA